MRYPHSNGGIGWLAVELTVTTFWAATCGATYTRRVEARNMKNDREVSMTQVVLIESRIERPIQGYLLRKNVE